MNPAEITERLEPILLHAILGAASVEQGDRAAVKRILTKASRDTLLATLDAIREPSASLLEIGCDAYARDEVIVVTQPLADAWREMIDALRREVAG